MRNNGDLRICTHAQHGTDHGLLRTPSGVPYNAGTDDISESRNSEMLRDVRRAMMDGQWHGACHRCKHEHESGMRSRNLVEIELWEKHFTVEDARRLTAADGSIKTDEVPLMHYGLRFGNKCNLACRMCGPTESNLWYEDYTAVWGTDKYNDSFGTVTLSRNDSGRLVPDTDRYTWYESDLFWDQLISNALNIVHVHTVGGEPTMIDEQYRFLGKCIDAGIASNLIVEYNTNVTAIPDKAWDLWKHFKEIRIGASIDGIGPVNDYIRHPSKWHVVERNLRRIDRDENINFVTWIASTVQAYNVMYIPEIMEYMMRARFSRIGWDPRSPLVNFHPLYGPKWLSSRVFPDKVKRAIGDSLSKKELMLHRAVDDIFGNDDHMRGLMSKGISDHISSYTRFMWQEDLSHLMDKFWSYTMRLDDIRGERMSDSLPELHDAIVSNWRPAC